MIVHHPSSDLLADCARGMRNGGTTLVVAAHVHACAVCRAEMALWESVGGALLQQEAPAPLTEGAFQRTLARLNAAAAPGEEDRRESLPRYLEPFALPAALRAQNFGRRIWLTPNIWFAAVGAHAESATRTYLMHGRPDTRLSLHTHAGREFTAVLHGSFRDVSGIYGTGDFAEADPEVTHAPTVTGPSDCLCLISADAPMRLFNPIAKAIQALTGKSY